MKVTIEDVARVAGVSRSTVSRVLQNGKNIDPNTRETVLKAVELCNYRPSSLARGFAKGKLNFIGLIVGDIRNTFYADIVRAAEDVLNQHGYLVVLCDSDYRVEREENYLNLFGDFGFSGVIMTSAMESEELIKTLERLKCPVILINRYLRNYETSVVSSDNRTGGYLAAEHLLKIGHRNIALLAGFTNSTASQERLQGWLDAFRDYGAAPQFVVEDGNLSMEDGRKFARRILGMPMAQRPTAVCAGNDSMAQGIIEEMLENGCRVPEDLSVVGYDDISSSTIGKVPLTTIRQSQDEMGWAAANLLLRQIQCDASANQRIIFQPKFILRQSTCPAAQRDEPGRGIENV